jgi:hypothetical protein
MQIYVNMLMLGEKASNWMDKVTKYLKSMNENVPE